MKTVQVQFGDKALQLLDELKSASGERTQAGVLKAALGLYCWAHEKVQQGYLVGAFGRGKEPVALELFSTGTGFQVMTEDDAVLAAGFCRFAIRCAESGEEVTALAAAKVAAIATLLGIRATCAPSMDWDWATKLREAMQVVEESGNLDRVVRLDQLLSDLSVSDVEGYEP